MSKMGQVVLSSQQGSRLIVVSGDVPVNLRLDLSSRNQLPRSSCRHGQATNSRPSSNSEMSRDAATADSSKGPPPVKGTADGSDSAANLVTCASTEKSPYYLRPRKASTAPCQLKKQIRKKKAPNKKEEPKAKNETKETPGTSASAQTRRPKRSHSKTEEGPGAKKPSLVVSSAAKTLRMMKVPNGSKSSKTNVADVGVKQERDKLHANDTFMRVWDAFLINNGYAQNRSLLMTCLQFAAKYGNMILSTPGCLKVFQNLLLSLRSRDIEDVLRRLDSHRYAQIKIARVDADKP